MEEAEVADTGRDARAGFRLGYVPGATPAKWARVWQVRHPTTRLHLIDVPAGLAERALTAGELDAALLRPPVDRERLHAIELYAEEPVVVVPRDHVVAALADDEAVTAQDLAEDVLLQAADDVLAWSGRPGAATDAIARPGLPPQATPETTADAIELVAAGVGLLVVPRSLARLHHRKDLTARPLADGPAAPVALAWLIEGADEQIEDLIGIVRGRTVNSSRGRAPEPSEPDARRRRSAPNHRSGPQPRARGRGGRRGR